MINPIKIILPVKDFNIATNRLDTWVTEAIKASTHAKQELIKNNFSLSRTRIKKLIEKNNLKIDDVIIKDPSYKVKINNIIKIWLPIPITSIPLPEKIDLDIIYEDEFLIVLNKKSGLVVHPAPGHPDGTLVNAILYHCGESLQGIGGVKRPGIVHRLDKNTSGVMVIAKTELSHVRLCKIFSNHDLDRRYNAIVWGHPQNEGYIDQKIARSLVNRKKMAVSGNGKIAMTRWKVKDIFAPFASLIECKLETGRTHQIRVHLSNLGYNVVGDTLYGKTLSQKKVKKEFDIQKFQLLKSFERQALHATKLSFKHPITKKYLEFKSALPDDMTKLIQILKKDNIYNKE